MEMSFHSVLIVEKAGLDTWMSREGYCFQELTPSYDQYEAVKTFLELIKLYRNFWVDKNNIQRRFEQIHFQGTPYIAVAKGKTSGASNYPDTVASRSFRYDGITERNKQPFNRGTSLVKPHPLPRPAPRNQPRAGSEEHDFTSVRYTRLQSNSYDFENVQIEHKNFQVVHPTISQKPQARERQRIHTNETNYSEDSSEVQCKAAPANQSPPVKRQLTPHDQAQTGDHEALSNAGCADCPDVLIERRPHDAAQLPAVTSRERPEENQTPLNAAENSNNSQANVSISKESTQQQVCNELGDQNHLRRTISSEESRSAEATAHQESKDSETGFSTDTVENAPADRGLCIQNLLNQSLYNESTKTEKREDDSDTTNNIDLASVLNLTMTSPDTEPSEKTEHPTQTEQVTSPTKIVKAEEQIHRMEECSVQSMQPHKVDVPGQNTDDGRIDKLPLYKESDVSADDAPELLSLPEGDTKKSAPEPPKQKNMDIEMCGATQYKAVVITETSIRSGETAGGRTMHPQLLADNDNPSLGGLAVQKDQLTTVSEILINQTPADTGGLTSQQESDDFRQQMSQATNPPSCSASSGIGEDEASIVSQSSGEVKVGSLVDSHSELNLSDMETAEESAEYISDDGEFDKLISDIDSIFTKGGILEWQAMQDPGDLKKIFLFTEEVLTVKEELENAANGYEGYKLVLRKQREIFTPLTGFKESARMPFTFKTWKTDEQGGRSVITESTCEMVVRAEARCRNGKPVECDYFAVISAHHILSLKQRFDLRCVDYQPTFNEIWDKICSPSQNLSFGLVANDASREVIDTVGTPLYRQWHFMPTAGYGVNEFDSFANDILLFRLDYAQLKAQGWLEKDPKTQLSRLEVYSGPFSLGHDNYKYVHAKIKGIVPLRNKKGYGKLLSKRGIKVIVNNKLGKLEVTRFITKTKTNYSPGYHLALSLDSGLRLEKGDSGSVVYTISKADKKQVYALGMLVGSFKDNEMSCEGLYQAIALWPALRQIEYHHSERIGDIRLIGCDEVKDKESDKLLPDFVDSGMYVD